MLAELSFSPSIFLKSSYDVDELCDARLNSIRKGLLEYTISHDLRDGSLSRHALSHEELHPKAKELLKKMQKGRRLKPVPATGNHEPHETLEWIREATGSAERLPVGGIITCPSGKAQAQDQPLVTDISKCPTTEWWTGNVMRSSWMLTRTAADYLRHLEPLVRHANSLAFYDPYLDPSEARYAYLPAIFNSLLERPEKPMLEFHRVVYRGSGQARQLLDQKALQEAFAPLSYHLSKLGVAATVFAWADDHNRYLISDLGCFQFGNSLDTSNDPNTHDTWARIERADADQIARLHDPAVNGARLSFRFEIGT